MNTRLQILFLFILFLIIYFIRHFIFNKKIEKHYIFNVNTNLENLKITFKYAIKMIKELKLPYMLAYGTALGCIRNNNLIPYETDIDIAIFYNDILKKYNYNLTIDNISKDFNKIAKKNYFKPLSIKSTPYVYIKNNKYIPIMFQYRNTISNITADFYIFFEKDNYYWDFCEGGERSGYGHRYPKLNYTYGNMMGKKFPVMPIEYMEIIYGKKWNVPQKKNEYLPMKKTLFQSNQELNDEWLIP